MDYAGKALNLSGDCQEELLKSAEYGAGLYFTFADAETTVLQNTYYTQYFGANYDSWKERMMEIYSRYNEELGDIYAERIVDHEILEDGVARTTYENGTNVYVNYNVTDYRTNDGIVIPARDYLVTHE